MTARRSTLRGRRSTAGATNIPKYIAQWFSGARAISFTAATAPHCYRLREYWAAWSAVNPEAEPPPNFEVMAAAGESRRKLAERNGGKVN